MLDNQYAYAPQRIYAQQGQFAPATGPALLAQTAPAYAGQDYNPEGSPVGQMVGMSEYAAPEPVPQVQEEQRVTMVVPEGATPGTKLQYQAPDGQELRLTVPEGVPAGSVMTLTQDPVSKQWKCMAEPADAPTAPPPVATYEAPPAPAAAYVPPTPVEGRVIQATSTLTPAGTPAVTTYQTSAMAVQAAPAVTTVTRHCGGVQPMQVNLSYVPPPVPLTSSVAMVPGQAVIADPLHQSRPVVPAAPYVAPYPAAAEAYVVGQRPSYTPPPVLLEQRPSYTPPPVTVLENRPSYTPMPQILPGVRPAMPMVMPCGMAAAQPVQPCMGLPVQGLQACPASPPIVPGMTAPAPLAAYAPPALLPQQPPQQQGSYVPPVQLPGVQTAPCGAEATAQASVRVPSAMTAQSPSIMTIPAQQGAPPRQAQPPFQPGLQQQQQQQQQQGLPQPPPQGQFMPMVPGQPPFGPGPSGPAAGGWPPPQLPPDLQQQQQQLGAPPLYMGTTPFAEGGHHPAQASNFMPGMPQPGMGMPQPGMGFFPGPPMASPMGPMGPQGVQPNLPNPPPMGMFGPPPGGMGAMPGGPPPGPGQFPGAPPAMYGQPGPGAMNAWQGPGQGQPPTFGSGPGP